MWHCGNAVLYNQCRHMQAHGVPHAIENVQHSMTCAGMLLPGSQTRLNGPGAWCLVYKLFSKWHLITTV